MHTLSALLVKLTKERVQHIVGAEAEELRDSNLDLHVEVSAQYVANMRVWQCAAFSTLASCDCRSPEIPRREQCQTPPLL